MTEIRPLERADLPEVVRLYTLVMRDEAQDDPELVRFFASTLIDQPWADPELPSLVAESDGELVGFIGSNVRRMSHDGRQVRMVCSAHLVSHPDARKQAIGAKLMRTLLDGPQDLTITDGATDDVRRMWEAFGGQAVPLGAFSFVRLLRPWSLGATMLHDRHELSGLRPASRALGRGLDRATEAFSGDRFRPTAPAATAEPLTPELVVEHVQRVAADARLHAEYDVPYLAWLFDELERVEGRGTLWSDGIARGRLWAELVRSKGRVDGWYVCHLRPSGPCRVLQLAATPRGADTVFDQLAFRARLLGAAAVYGRLEPRFVPSVTTTGCLLRPSDGRLLVHARDPELALAVRAGDALLTRMDGEWW